MNPEQPAPKPEPMRRGAAARHCPWDAATGLREVSVPLLELPAGLKFNGDFPEPIRYDPERRAIVYRGVMPHASYLYLRSLSRDLRYQLAIERLFVETAVKSSPRGRHRPATVAVAVGSLTLAALALFLLLPPARQTDLLDGDSDPPSVTADADPIDAPAPAGESPGSDPTAAAREPSEDRPANSAG